jgi:hypothetical protein
VFASEGMLSVLAGASTRSGRLSRSQNPPRWVGMDVYGAALLTPSGAEAEPAEASYGKT